MQTTQTVRHEPTDECNGHPVVECGVPRRFGHCDECGLDMCSCEVAYGHDCEA